MNAPDLGSLPDRLRIHTGSLQATCARQPARLLRRSETSERQAALDPVIKMHGHLKAGTKILLIILFLGAISRTVPSKPTGAFAEGHYSLRPGYLGGDEFEFRNGRFRRTSFSDCREDIPAALGRYTLAGSCITLTFDNTRYRPEILHWRLIDGIDVLLNKEAVVIYDTEKTLDFSKRADDVARYYILKRYPAEDADVWWIGLLRQHPGFRTRLPQYERDEYNLSWWNYQRMRWNAFRSEHATVFYRLPQWINNLLP